MMAQTDPAMNAIVTPYATSVMPTTSVMPILHDGQRTHHTSSYWYFATMAAMATTTRVKPSTGFGV
jgi:hypothetical protein